MKKSKDKKPTFELWEVIVIAIVSSIIMSLGTGYIAFRNNSLANVTNNKNLQEFVKSYNSILNNYYDNVNEEELVDAAIKGMLNYLQDPYTTYLNESSKSALTSSLTGTYEGIGVQVTSDEENRVYITKVFDDTPAKTAGLEPGDIIVNVNDTDVTEKTSNEIVSLIKESKDAKVKITVLRENVSKTFELTRENLYVPAVLSKIYTREDKKVGYIYIDKFSDTIYEQFSKELTKLENDNINSLVIDVRNNTGGYLNGATKIAELFLEKGKVIYSLENKTNTEVTKDTTPEKRDYKVAVIINNGSASASEVLAGALKYSYGATLVGVKSYGKGKVQQTTNLEDGSMIKYTTARWLTPSNECIDGIGLTPDIEQELPENFEEDNSEENDKQLQSAIDFLVAN